MGQKQITHSSQLKHGETLKVGKLPIGLRIKDLREVAIALAHGFNEKGRQLTEQESVTLLERLGLTEGDYCITKRSNSDFEFNELEFKDHGLA